jgi:hypothetical protein
MAADEKQPPPPSEALLISALADIIERLRRWPRMLLWRPRLELRSP